LRAAVGQKLTVEQIKTDVDRRLASERATQRAPVEVRLDRMRTNGAGAAPQGFRRVALEEERREVLGRIEELERELRGLSQRLREIDHQLALPS
jgi:hypothetical protein